MTSSKSGGPRPVPAPQGGSTRQAHAYARFIPREELADFASWTPDALGRPHADAGATAVAPRTAGLAKRTADGVPPPPESSAEEWQARVQTARQHGYQDGYRDGLAALEAAKRQHLVRLTAQFAPLLSSFTEQMGALEARMAAALADTAVALARQVVRSELAQRPDCVVQVARESLEAVMLSARHLRMRMHPDDMALISEGADDALRARQVALLGDPALARGGCVVESDLGQVDASVESRWARAAAVFGIGLGWHSADPVASEPVTQGSPAVAGDAAGLGDGEAA